MAKTIAVDFDGVIHRYSRGWDDGTCYDDPIPEAFESIKSILDKGYSVFVHTTRDVLQVIDWLGKHHAPFDAVAIGDDVTFWNGDVSENDRHIIGVSNRKLPAVVYIDDRALRFVTWASATMTLERLEKQGF